MRKFLKIDTHGSSSGTSGPTYFYEVNPNFDLDKARKEYEQARKHNEPLGDSKVFEETLKNNGAVKIEGDSVINGGTIVCGSHVEWIITVPSS